MDFEPTKEETRILIVVSVIIFITAFVVSSHPWLSEENIQSEFEKQYPLMSDFYHVENVGWEPFGQEFLVRSDITGWVVSTGRVDIFGQLTMYGDL